MLTSSPILTYAGQNLEIRAKTEGKQIQFLYFKVGDGDVPTLDEIKNLTDIAGLEIIRADVALVAAQDSTSYVVSGQYSNEDFTEAKQVREYGLFAQLVGDTTPVLYSYMGLGTGTTMPPYTGISWFQIIEFLTIVTQDTMVLVQYNPTALVDMETFVNELAKKVDKTQIVQEPLTKATDKVLSGTASNVLFENGVGAQVRGYIEDATQHNVGEIWLSKNTKGEFKCLVANTDNFIDVAKWVQIDDLANASKLENLQDIIPVNFTYIHPNIVSGGELSGNIKAGVAYIEFASGSNFTLAAQEKILEWDNCAAFQGKTVMAFDETRTPESKRLQLYETSIANNDTPITDGSPNRMILDISFLIR